VSEFSRPTAILDHEETRTRGLKYQRLGTQDHDKRGHRRADVAEPNRVHSGSRKTAAAAVTPGRHPVGDAADRVASDNDRVPPCNRATAPNLYHRVVARSRCQVPPTPSDGRRASSGKDGERERQPREQSAHETFPVEHVRETTVPSHNLQNFKPHLTPPSRRAPPRHPRPSSVPSGRRAACTPAARAARAPTDYDRSER
jgi:hypothetical protein